MTSREAPGSALDGVASFAPKLAQLTKDVLFGDVWSRPGLSPRDRALVTVAALVSTGNVEQLRFHAPRAQQLGVTRDELSEVMVHLAFYAGWPRAISAIELIKDLLDPEPGEQLAEDA